jgi:hypothetical protein
MGDTRVFDAGVAVCREVQLVRHGRVNEKVWMEVVVEHESGKLDGSIAIARFEYRW